MQAIQLTLALEEPPVHDDGPWVQMDEATRAAAIASLAQAIAKVMTTHLAPSPEMPHD